MGGHRLFGGRNQPWCDRHEVAAEHDRVRIDHADQRGQTLTESGSDLREAGRDCRGRPGPARPRARRVPRGLDLLHADGVEHARRPMLASQQPVRPQPHGAPGSPSGRCPTSPANPAGAADEVAAVDDPRADADGARQVQRAGGHHGAAPWLSSASAAQLASLSMADRDGARSPVAARRPGRDRSARGWAPTARRHHRPTPGRARLPTVRRDHRHRRGSP